MVRIAVIDDHQIVIDGVKALLHNNTDFKVVLESTSPAQFLDALMNTKVDIVLTDIFMPEMSGEELAKKIAVHFPEIHIVVLSMGGQSILVRNMITDSNIKGFLLKNIGKTEMLQALNKVNSGGVYFSEEILKDMMAVSAVPEQKVSSLTNREIEILKLIELEKSNKQIADELFISERTVETHRKNIYRKTDTNSVIGLVKYAYLNKLIT